MRVGEESLPSCSPLLEGEGEGEGGGEGGGKRDCMKKWLEESEYEEYCFGSSS